jgi:hypothetical protein
MHRRLRSLIVLVCLACLTAGALPHATGAQDTGSLQREIQRKRDREAALGSQAARLGALERRVAREAAILGRRLAAVQAQLDAAQAAFARTQDDLRAERARALRLRHRLADARIALARLLRDRYESAKPDLVTVVLNAHGFADLLERMAFVKRVQQRDTQIVGVVRDARSESRVEARRLAVLERRRREEATTVQRQRDAVASIAQAAQARRDALAQARAARLAARRATAAGRRRAQRTLDRLIAERERAARAVGPGGPWAIPWAIVQCESGGQNLPPNSAGASGYYQFLPDTWRRLGGSTPTAYQASKAEQDRLAARLWDGGRGARNWVCAGLVGIL